MFVKKEGSKGSGWSIKKKNGVAMTWICYMHVWNCQKKNKIILKESGLSLYKKM